MTYFNTVMEVSKLNEYNDKALEQDRAILMFFKAHRIGCYTPFEVHSGIGINYEDVPITSIRRSITNLTHRGDLIKTDNKKLERLGRKNYCWRLKR